MSSWKNLFGAKPKTASEFKPISSSPSPSSPVTAFPPTEAPTLQTKNIVVEQLLKAFNKSALDDDVRFASDYLAACHPFLWADQNAELKEVACRKEISHFPEDASLWYVCAYIIFMQKPRGVDQEVDRCLLEFIQRAYPPPNDKSTEVAQEWFDRANLYGRFMLAEAILAIRIAGLINPNHPQLFVESIRLELRILPALDKGGI